MSDAAEKAAKLSDVARAAGVSQGTVSNVFSRPQVVRPEVREHVHEVARRLGYRGPDPKGRLLRAGKVNAIGIATQERLPHFFADPYTRGVMEGISEAADAAGAGISLVSAANDEALAWNIQSALVDGFVLFCIEGGERLVRLTRERQLPFVALALSDDDATVATIGVATHANGDPARWPDHIGSWRDRTLDCRRRMVRWLVAGRDRHRELEHLVVRTRHQPQRLQRAQIARSGNSASNWSRRSLRQCANSVSEP